MFECKIENQNGISVLSFDGKLNALTASELKQELNKIIEQKSKKVIVDCGNLDIIDSSGIGALVSLFKRVRSYGGNLQICSLSGQPKEIFALLNLDKAFDLSENIAESLKKMS